MELQGKALTVATPSSNHKKDPSTHLLITAIRLYAEYGTKGASLREITRQAGMRNEAAVRYYFGGKSGLLRGAVDYIASDISPRQTQSLLTLSAMAERRQITVRDVLTAEFLPIVNYYRSSDFGADAVRLLARLIREEGSVGQDLLVIFFGDWLMEIEGYLRTLLPEKSSTAIRLHHFLAINNMLNGIADQALLERLPAVSEGDHFQISESALLQGFMEYLAAGVATSSAL